MPFLCAFVSSCEIIAVPVSEVDGTDAAGLKGKYFTTETQRSQSQKLVERASLATPTFGR